MSLRPLLLAALALHGCNAEQSRGASDSCEETLRASLPHWHEQVKTAAQEVQRLSMADPSDGALTKAQVELQLSSWAASSATHAHLRYRSYGGDTSRNKAKGEDVAAERRRAAEAARLALDAMAAPPSALEGVVNEMVEACR